MKHIILVLLLSPYLGLSQGLIFDKEGFLNGEKIERTRDDRVPKVASLKGYTPYVLTQNRSNCVAYSVASTRTMLFARDNNISGKDTITTYLFSPHWVYYRNKSTDDDDCMQGLDLEKVSNDVLNNGIPPMLYVEYEKYYPWGTTELCNFYPNSYSEDKELAVKFKVDDVFRLQNLEDIKLAISNGMPCVVGMLVPPSFKAVTNKMKWSASPTDTYDDAYGHAMVIVGYDDYKFGGAVELMNSWGTEWGNEGYIWIPYDDFLKYTLGAYAYHTTGRSDKIIDQTDSLLLKDRLLSTNIDTSLIEKFNSLKPLLID